MNIFSKDLVFNFFRKCWLKLLVQDWEITFLVFGHHWVDLAGLTVFYSFFEKDWLKNLFLYLLYTLVIDLIGTFLEVNFFEKGIIIVWVDLFNIISIFILLGLLNLTLLYDILNWIILLPHWCIFLPLRFFLLFLFWNTFQSKLFLIACEHV